MGSGTQSGRNGSWDATEGGARSEGRWVSSSGVKRQVFGFGAASGPRLEALARHLVDVASTGRPRVRDLQRLLDQVACDGTQSRWWGTQPRENDGVLRRRSGIDNVQLSNPAWIRPVALSQLVADRFLTGRAALVGDANHEFSSVAGQGLHFAIEDALNLGWKLALTISGSAAPSLLQTYEMERRERVEEDR